MTVRIHLKDTSFFILYNVTRMGLMKHIYEGKRRRIMYFRDKELGILAYPVADIVEMSVED